MKLKNIVKQIGHLFKDSWYVFWMERGWLKKKAVLLESEGGEEAGSNILYMLQELSEKKEYKTLKLYLAVNEEKIPEVKMLLEHYNVTRAEMVKRYSLAYFRLLATARYVVTDTTFPRRYIKRKGQIYMNTWHGTSFKKLGKDIPSGAYAIGNVQRNLLMADYIVSPGEYAIQRLCKAHNLENLYQGTYVLAGYPRNQVFFHPGERIALRKSLGLQEEKVYCYMPTWRGVVRESDAGEGARIQGKTVKAILDQLDKSLGEGELLFVRLHPYANQELACEKYRHIRLFPKGYDPYAFLNLADCLITDYSSVFFDYANRRDGKIILFLYDREAFQASRDYYMDPEELPFPVAENVPELLRQLRSPREYDDSEFRKKYCAYDHPDASGELCRLLIKGETGSHMRLEQAKGNGKKNLLFYVGGLSRNGITTSFLNLMEYMKDQGTEYNYYAAFQEEYFKDTPERVGILPEFVDILPMSKGWNLTFLEALACYIYYKGNIDNFIVQRYLKRFYSREYRRNFGWEEFAWCIHFTGYERKITGLFGCAPGRKAIFSHNNMFLEIPLKHNQHFLTLQRAYREYDLVLAVGKDIYDMARFISEKEENLHIVENCHDYKRVKKRAEEPICFDKTTRCTVTREELEKRLQGPEEKFITIGRFSVEKGHNRLLEAFAAYHREYPQSLLILIGGGGDLYEKTIEKAEKLGLAQAVIFIYSIENPMPILKRCDLFLLSSFYEGLGLVLLEADTLGLPLISTNVSGPRGFMKAHGGRLVDSTAEGLLEGMHSYRRGEITPLKVDYEKRNQQAVKTFLDLLSDK